jgi:glyceraldehyde 3-phosphate dehydrogenase
MTKIAINGFGRIGRPVFKKILDKFPQLEMAVINDLTDAKTLAHLLKYDSCYGRYDKEVEHKSDGIIVGGKTIKILAEKDPLNLPWKEMDVDVVLECTGRYTDYEGAKKHLDAGAKKVIISAPCKSEKVPTYILGVNNEQYAADRDNIISMASCTSNCLAPVVKVLNDKLGIEKALMTTAHSYTNDQRILDLPHEDLRRARAATLSIIPTTTGAAIAVTRAIPELEGKFHGISLRVPTPVVSICDLVAEVKRETSAEEVNFILNEAAKEEKLKNILAVETEPLVSVDYRGSEYSAIVDAPCTMVIGGNMVKILAWYDNEWGYACRLAEMTDFVAEKL